MTESIAELVEKVEKSGGIWEDADLERILAAYREVMDDVKHAQGIALERKKRIRALESKLQVAREALEAASRAIWCMDAGHRGHAKTKCTQCGALSRCEKALKKLEGGE
tara:strand:+ start:2531 stop:2857 length:327 start_codon:yes stop_codon:yes gene_type:complete